MTTERGWSSGAETGPQTPSFADAKLDFENLPQTEERKDGKGYAFKTCEATADTLLEDGPARMTTRAIRKFDTNGSLATESLRTGIVRDGGEISGRLTVTYIDTAGPAKEIPTAIMGITRNDPDKNLPKGLGMQLYRKMLGLAADISKQRRVPIKHKVSRTLSMSDTPMSPEKWNEIFEPLLLSEGYEKVEDGEWTKTYEPRKGA